MSYQSFILSLWNAFRQVVHDNTFTGIVQKVQKQKQTNKKKPNYLPKEEGREGGEKSMCSAPAWARART